MTAGYKPRGPLNRDDPRVRGTVTWLPLDGHFSNLGDIGGRITPPASTGGWQPSPLSGTFLLDDTANVTADTVLTSTRMGVDGFKNKTVIFEYFHANNATVAHLFAFGDESTDNLFAVYKASATAINVDTSTGITNATATITAGSYVRAVVRFDGSNVYLDVRTYTPATDTWAFVSASGAAGTLFTGSTGLGLHYYPTTASADNASGLSWLGIFGGALWTDAETRAFLIDPTTLWTPNPGWVGRYSAAGTVYNDTIADSVTAADSLAVGLTTSGSVSDAATSADSLSVALTARPALSDAATAADSNAVALTARPTLSDAVTGADTSAAALTANASISDAVTGGDAITGGKATSDPLTDTVAGADSLAAALTARPAVSDAVTSADSQAAALIARPALSDSVTAGDTIAPALTTAATIADAATAADAVAGVKVTSGTIADGATAGEAATVAATFAATLTDGVTAGDGVTGTTGEQVEDDVTAGDGAAVSATFAAALADGVVSGDDVTASGGTPPAPSTGITGGGPLVPMPRRRRWRVRTPGGLLEGFDTAEAAYARFEELYGDPAPATPTKGGAAPRRISVPSIPPRTVALGDADATRSFARLLRDMQAEREGEARARVAAMLDQIAFDAARRAAQLEDDDEAAAVLLLM